MSISGLLRLKATAKRIPAKMTLREVGTWAYAPYADPDHIHAADIDMAVVNYSIDGTDEGCPTPKEMELMRRGPDGAPRLILCNLAAAVADPSRPYWPQGGMPGWAISDWKDGYAVYIMSKEWRAILLEEVEKAIGTGFDGIFLDCDYLVPIDLDMADLVWRVREKIGNRTLVVANGEYMAPIPGFLDIVDGLARVGLYSVESSIYERDEVEDYLVYAEDKPIFVVEFVQDEDDAPRMRRRVSEMGWNPCIVTPHGFT